ALVAERNQPRSHTKQHQTWPQYFCRSASCRFVWLRGSCLPLIIGLTIYSLTLHFLEEDSRQLHAVQLQTFGEARAHACRAEATDDTPIFVHALAFVLENLLHRDRLALHPCDLGDGSDAARAVGEARGLNDEVERRRDLLAHRAI